MRTVSGYSMNSVVGAVGHLLLDFDGPVCALFGGVDVSELLLRSTVQHECSPLVPLMKQYCRDPLALLRSPSVQGDPVILAAAEKIVREVELEGARTAPRNADLEVFLERLHQQRVPVSVVSNNSIEAVTIFKRHDSLMREMVAFCRPESMPHLMKPSPYLVEQAIIAGGVDRGLCVLLGDSETDICAAHAAGIRAVGYANKHGKRERLEAVGADHVIDSLLQFEA